MTTPNTTARQAGLTDEQKDKFVADLIEYGTEFVAPLYAVVENIERAALAAHSADARNGEGVALSEHQWHEAFAAKAINGAMLNVRMAVEIVMETLAAPDAPAPTWTEGMIADVQARGAEIGAKLERRARLPDEPAPAAQAEADTIHAAWVAAGTPHDIVSFQKGWQAARQQSATPAAPIYQVWEDYEGWSDVSASGYASYPTDDRRIVYATPPASSQAEATSEADKGDAERFQKALRRLLTAVVALDASYDGPGSVFAMALDEQRTAIENARTELQRERQQGANRG